MKIQQKVINTRGIKLFIRQNEREIARAYLFILFNDFRRRKYGLMEDVYVDENLRGKGVGTKLIKRIVKVAKKNNCYKIVATSRYGRAKLHGFYQKLGFKKFGFEFKMYLEKL